MVTRELAQRFCSFFNQAKAGEIISILPDGQLLVGANEDSECWMSKVKRQGESCESTKEAYDFLLECQRQAIAQLNAAGQM